MSLIKQAALAVTAQPMVGRLLGAFGDSRCAILMLHRFASRQGTMHGHDAAALRTTLAGLRKSGVAFEYVDDVVARLHNGAPWSSKARLSVAITVDDGYADVLDVEHIFAEFDCPITGFVVPDVIDGRVWFWWDQIDWLFRHAAADHVSLMVGGEALTLAWQDAVTRHMVQSQLGERLKLVPNAERLACIARLSAQLNVTLPPQIPDAYRVLTWDELRAAETRGMRFGPHTMTHPILSQCADADAAWEVSGAIERVRSELSNPSLVFCYPNGRAIDYGARETAIIAAAGMLGAVSTEPALVTASPAAKRPADWLFRLSRFSYDDRRGGIQRMFLPQY